MDKTLQQELKVEVFEPLAQKFIQTCANNDGGICRECLTDILLNGFLLDEQNKRKSFWIGWGMGGLVFFLSFLLFKVIADFFQ